MHNFGRPVDRNDIADIAPEVLDDDAGKVAPCSYAQQRLWFFDRLNPGSALYNVEHVEPLAGPLDLGALRRALGEIVSRHDALRTVFRSVHGHPVQVIGRPGPVTLAHFDMTGRQPDQQDIDVRRTIADEIRTGFDLERGPLIRFTVIELEQQHLLLLVAHHIVFDLWSVGVFSHELAALYASFRAGSGSPLPAPVLSYASYVAAERPRFESAEADPQLVYWRHRLAGLPRSTELPTDRLRPPVQTFHGALRPFFVPAEVARPFRALTRGAGATLFMSLFAAFIVLIHRYSGQIDLAVGTPIANRSRPHLGEMIGLLLNMLVLRVDVGDDPTVSDLLERVVGTSLDAFDHQDVPFELLVEDLKPERDPSRNPLFQTMFVFQPGRPGQADEEDLPVGESNGAKFDITLTMTDTAPGLTGAIEFNTDLFDATTIERLIVHYQSILVAMSAEPDTRISNLPLLTPMERQRILVDWNTRSPSLSPKGCLHHLFEQAAAMNPSAIAVSAGEGQLTYGALDDRANELAAELRRLGAAAEVRVGICMERSLDWIVAIFAVLKSGAAMVPLEAAFPRERLAFMIEDASISIIVTQAALATKVEGTGALVLTMDRPRPPVEPAMSASQSATTADGLAYVVYTSGSTGLPKGVLVQHDGAVNFIAAQMKDWAIGPGSRVLQFTAFGFDIGLSEIFLTLCSGAEFCLAPADDLRAGPPLLRTLREQRITHVTLPPSALAAMQPEALPDLGTIISAGEACEPDLARRWGSGRRIVNAYGPTEATIYATIGELDRATGLFPVGRPIANVQVYVLDRHRQPVPPGVMGEIFIGGIGVARGYLNRPELTAERFVPDDFCGRAGARLYATGDFGRFDPGGTLHHFGRKDGQLKIRGYRIEPGEIESVLRLHDQVADALVLGHGAGPDARLVAFIVPTDAPPLVVELRGFLARRLPDYMTPAAYVMVDAWPKTSNGKIDRAALGRHDTAARSSATTFIAPVDDLEQTIAAAWRDCLEIEDIGVNDNFFDLGGHSLLLVRVYDQLKTSLKVDLSLIDLFRFPTIKLQADMLRARTAQRPETEVLGRADQRAARQNAARMQRRTRSGADRHA